MSNEIKKGLIAVVKPEELEVSFEEIEIEDTEEGRKKAIEKIIELTTGDIENGKMNNLGFLPNPIHEFTAFVDFDQFNPDTKYNFSLFGNPFYGNVTFLQVDTKSDNGAIIPIDDNHKNIIKNFVERFKKFEKESGIYKNISETDKISFLKEFAKEQTSVLAESTKNIEGNNAEELKAAKEELEKLKQEGKIDIDNKEE